jgi:hypothetical protein
MPRTEWLAGARSRPSKLASFHATLNQGLPL